MFSPALFFLFFREQFAVNRQNLFWTHSELFPICSICQHDSDFFIYLFFSRILQALSCVWAASPRGDVGLEKSHGWGPRAKPCSLWILNRDPKSLGSLQTPLLALFAFNEGQTWNKT